MTCDDARAAVLAGVDGPAERTHVASCPRCREAAPRLAALGAMLSDPAAWTEPSVELADRVAASIRPPHVPAPRRRRRLAPTAVAAAVAVAAGFLALRPEPPDWTVELAGTAPGAGGVVSGWNGDAGSRMLLTAEGLDPAPAGSVYELWLSSGDRHVSAGTFTDPTGIELSVGVHRRDFPRIWVTVEPLDDDPSPSGDTVLDSWPGR